MGMIRIWTPALLLSAPALAWAQSVTFRPPKDVAAGSVQGVSSMDAGDIDRDGLADVVAIEGGKHAGGRRTFAWFKAPADTQGSWSRHDFSHGATLRSFLGSAKLADLDGDGDLDLVVSSDNHSGTSKQADVLVFLNPGGTATGTWTHHRANPSTMAVHHINDMEIADMDGDGRKDVVVRSLDPNQIHIFFQNSVSSWTHKTINTGIPESEGLAVGRLDADALPDITFTGVWLKSPASPRTQNYTTLSIDSNYRTVNQNTKEAIGDIDGDGRLDVIIGPAEAYRNGKNHHLAWYRNPGNTSSSNWPKTVIVPLTNNNHTVKLADLDADGDLDVVVGIPWANDVAAVSVRVHYNQVGGAFGAAQVVTSGKGLYSGVVVDLGADGDLDLVGQDTYANSSKPWVYESLRAGAPASPPAAPSGLTAATVSDVRIDLAWADNAPDETGFTVERSTAGGAYASIATLGANVRSYSNTGLAPSTTYAYRVRAQNAAGASAWSNVASAVTLAATIPLPNAPGSLGAVAASSSRIDLAWTDLSSNETGFRIERAVSGGAFALLASPGAGTTSHADTTVSPSTTYAYRVRAQNAGGSSAWSNTASAATPAAPASGNLALGRPVVASSSQSPHAAANSVDGSLATRWGSAYADAEWIRVDLGSTVSVNRVVLRWEAAYGRAYQIQVSADAVSWTAVYATSAGDGATDDVSFASASARHVRLLGVQRATSWGYSLWELEVFGAETAPPPPSGNLALGRTATASSTQSPHAPSRGVDGSTTTRWSSQYTDAEWIRVDLGAPTPVGRVILAWEAAYGREYQIQTSLDGAGWTTVWATAAGDGGVDDLAFTPVIARFVRMNGIRRGTAWGYSLWEFEVYADDVSAAASVALSASAFGPDDEPAGEAEEGGARCGLTGAEILLLLVLAARRRGRLVGR